MVVLVVGAAAGTTTFLQIRDYLLVAPEELTIRYKGGRQWVVLRQMGRELARRATVWNEPQLYVWGWQSPLHFYAQLDSPTRHFFVDNLLRDQADRDHPLIEPAHRGNRRKLAAASSGVGIHGLSAVSAAPNLLE